VDLAVEATEAATEAVKVVVGLAGAAARGGVAEVVAIQEERRVGAELQAGTDRFLSARFLSRPAAAARLHQHRRCSCL